MAWFWFACFIGALLWSAYLMHLLDLSQSDVRAFRKEGRPVPDLDALLNATKED